MSNEKPITPADLADALREALAAVVERWQGWVEEGVGPIEGGAVCTICAADADTTEAEVQHDAQDPCGKAAALLARWDAQGGDVALVEALASSGERGAALASVSGALADAGVAVGAAMEFGLDVRALAAERDAALARATQAEAEAELWRMRLTACDVAALQDTLTSREQRIARDNPYWSAAYESVCRRVDECIGLRAIGSSERKLTDETMGRVAAAEARAAAAEAEVGRLRAIVEEAARSLEWIRDRRTERNETQSDVLHEQRQYAGSRATVARAALSGPAPAGEWVQYVELTREGDVYVRSSPTTWPVVLTLTGTEHCITRDRARALAVALLSAAARGGK